MSDFIGMLTDFPDWKKLTGDVYQITQSQNAAGQTVEGETLLQSSVELWKWTETSIQTNLSDKFVDRETAKIIFDPAKITFTPNVSQYIVVADGRKYNFDGIDNVMEFDEVWLLTASREYGK